MADNYTANVGVGLQFAADDIGGVLYPRVKLSVGSDGFGSDVSVSDPMPVRSTAVDGGIGTGLWLSGGIFFAVPEAFPAIDQTLGISRITQRRDVLQAPDAQIVLVDPDLPVPDYSDLVGISGEPLASTDLAIVDTDPHYIVVPMAASNWRRVVIVIAPASRSGALDEPITWSLYGASKTSTGKLVLLAAATIAANDGFTFGIGEGAVGQGGTAGGATVATMAHYSVPAINAGWPYVVLKLVAVSAAPTTGGLEISVTRMSL